MGAETCDVLIVTALLDELEALHAVHGDAPGAWVEVPGPDGYPFFRRTIPDEAGSPLTLAAAWTGAMGEAAAATRAATLVAELEPACVAMCGICAGNRQKEVFLGDVIVADRIYSYDGGKLQVVVGEGGRREERLLPDLETYALDRGWKMVVERLARELAQGVRLARPPSRKSQESWLLFALLEHREGRGPHPSVHPDRKARCPGWTAIVPGLRARGLVVLEAGALALGAEGMAFVAEERALHPDGYGDPPFQVHVGAIATGKTVREDPGLFARLEERSRKTMGVEMEAAAIGLVAEHFRRPAIVVKGVSDWADEDKDDSFRSFAARASAEVLLRILRRLAPRRAPKAPQVEPTTVPATVPASAPAYAPARVFATNPFQSAGSLAPGHPTYVRRACDAALTRALAGEPLIAIEGDYRIGKSSLMLRAHAALGRAGAACHVDLSGLRTDDVTVFLNGFFRQIGRQLGKTTSDWPDLEEEARRRVLVLALDEFGHLGEEVLRSFVPPLHRLATDKSAQVRVMVCLPAPIKDLLRGAGLANPKYGQAFHRVLVGPIDQAGTDRLLELLTPRARRLCEGRRELVASRSRGYPHAVQRLCEELFDAEGEGASDEALRAIFEGSTWSEE